MDETNNDQSKKKVKCDFTFFFIFNGLTAIEYGSTSLCCGNSELIRVSLRVKLRFFKIHCETNILHSVIRIEVTDSGNNLADDGEKSQ